MKIKNDRLPSLNAKPISVSGAGDSMLVGASLSLALKNDKKIWLAALIGSLFSAIQVSRLGNIPVKAKELIELNKKGEVPEDFSKFVIGNSDSESYNFTNEESITRFDSSKTSKKKKRWERRERFKKNKLKARKRKHKNENS